MKKKDEKSKFKNSRVEQIQYHNSQFHSHGFHLGSERERLWGTKKSMWLLSTVPECYFAYFFSSFSVGRDAELQSSPELFARSPRVQKKGKQQKNSRRSMMMMVGMMMMMMTSLGRWAAAMCCNRMEIFRLYRKSLFISAWNSRKSTIFILKSASKSHKFSVK